MIVKADKCVITALLYRLPARGVVMNGLAVSKHFIPGLLKQPESIRRFERVDLHDFEIVNMARL